jgi:hypothetical protein
VTSEDKAVKKIVDALSDRAVSPRLVGIILRHRKVYTDSEAEKQIIGELIAGLLGQ